MGDVKWDLVVFSLEFHELPNMILNRSTSQKHDMYWMYHEHNWHKTIKHDVRHYYKIRDMGTFYTDAWIYGAWFFVVSKKVQEILSKETAWSQAVDLRIRSGRVPVEWIPWIDFW